MTQTFSDTRTSKNDTGSFPDLKSPNEAFSYGFSPCRKFCRTLATLGSEKFRETEERLSKRGNNSVPFIESILYSFLQRPLTLLGPGCPPGFLIGLLSTVLFPLFLKLPRAAVARVRAWPPSVEPTDRCLIIMSAAFSRLTNIEVDRSNETVSQTLLGERDLCHQIPVNVQPTAYFCYHRDLWKHG